MHLHPDGADEVDVEHADRGVHDRGLAEGRPECDLDDTLTVAVWRTPINDWCPCDCIPFLHVQPIDGRGTLRQGCKEIASGDVSATSRRVVV